ncbi:MULTISPECIES: hypothetical protein [unclassified Streptomyces]|uniref:hypothetical protein n=1 Tax=unclassified Streptomyces TaxID=2593676 RepID=UPI00081E8BA4|nr:MULTISPECIES: hypothetical protein [unclassified Streptomyces]MYZ40132.1 hypothetical protein [Streptomyces sp. SID4917]SCG06706.1 hypothetical protein GA0115259_110514 [Streptomyces sp. MnatMP-M17]
MAATPARAADPRDLYIADLRAALTAAKALVAFAAGQAAATDPEYSARLMAAAGGMDDVLSRTAPE